MRRRRAAKAGRLRHEAIVRDAVERAVDGTDKSIRLALGYQRKLFDAAEHCLEYANQLVDSIPQAIEFSRQSFYWDNRINALFVNADDLQTAFSRSSELRDFIDNPDNRGVSECCALLCMKKMEKRVFGMQLVGDMVQRDIAQTNVSFTDYQISWPSANEAETRKALKQCFFDGVLTSVLEHISSDGARKKELDRQHYLLRKKLKELELLLAESPATLGHADELEQIRIKLTEIEARRRTVGRSSPLHYLSKLNYALNHPEQLVRMQMTSITLNRLGVKIPEESEQKGERIELAEVEIGRSDSRVVVLAKFPTKEILPPKDLVLEASRYLAH